MHVKHFTYMANTIKSEQPELWTKDFQDHIIQNFKEAVQLEINWGKYYLEEGILGLKLSNLEEYIQYLGNKHHLESSKKSSQLKGFFKNAECHCSGSPNVVMRLLPKY